VAADVTASLDELASLGFDEHQIATTLELLLLDRSDGRKNEPQIDLVTSGPESPGISNRDTAVVVRELFSHAKKSVLVVGYAVYQGANVFEALAQRMEQVPDLDVKLFLNVARPDNDATKAEIIVSQYAQRFRNSQWPKGCRLPEVYYDPRSVAEDKRSSLHAKCVVVDAEQVFVSSANFTKAGQERNIEVGLKIESPWLAQRLIRHFELLHEHGLAVRAF
jgi:phosphatidylserine/phosphatidylglycerophosphate/cardiolipin synthase-like enzyme